MSRPSWRNINNPFYIPRIDRPPQPQPHPPPPGVLSSDQYSRSPISPPPGLIRATMPEPIGYYEYMRERRGRPVIRKNSDATLFGDVAKYIEQPIDQYGNHVMFDLTCNICCENKLEMPSRVSPPRNPEENVRVEPLCVLPCGHMFGAWCMDSWMATCREQKKCSDCPICRTLLHYDHCGHEIRIRHYDPRFRRAGQLALTLPEGGCIPSFCEWCRGRHVEHRADKIAHTIYPSDVPEASFINLLKCGPTEFRSMRNRMRDYLFDAFCDAEDHFDHW